MRSLLILTSDDDGLQYWHGHHCTARAIVEYLPTMVPFDSVADAHDAAERMVADAHDAGERLGYRIVEVALIGTPPDVSMQQTVVHEHEQ